LEVNEAIETSKHRPALLLVELDEQLELKVLALLVLNYLLSFGASLGL
jgi:hypothetical protein